MTDPDPRVAAWLAAARAHAADQLDKARAHLEAWRTLGPQVIADAEANAVAVREHAVTAHSNAEEEVARWEAEVAAWTSPDDAALRLARTGALVDPHPGLVFHRAEADRTAMVAGYAQQRADAIAAQPGGYDERALAAARDQADAAAAMAEDARDQADAYRGLVVTWALHGGPEPPPPGVNAFPPPATAGGQV